MSPLNDDSELHGMIIYQYRRRLRLEEKNIIRGSEILTTGPFIGVKPGIGDTSRPAATLKNPIESRDKARQRQPHFNVNLSGEIQSNVEEAFLFQQNTRP